MLDELFRLDLQLFAEDELPEEETAEGDDNLEESGEEEPEQQEEQPEEIPPEETYTKSQFDEKFQKEINRRHAKLHGEYEELGVQRDRIQQLSQAYGISPKDLLGTVYDQLEQGVPQERRMMAQQPPRDPRVDELLHEREVEKVQSQWEKDFGNKPLPDDIESIEEFQKDYVRQGKNLTFLEAYKLATRDTIRDKVVKETEAKVMNSLKEKRKGKVLPGSTSTVKGKPDTSKMSQREILRRYAEELDL